VRSKLIWKLLKTGRVSVAKLRQRLRLTVMQSNNQKTGKLRGRPPGF
jgi:hypothetical protein